jgi:hypothetical protein
VTLLKQVLFAGSGSNNEEEESLGDAMLQGRGLERKERERDPAHAVRMTLIDLHDQASQSHRRNLKAVQVQQQEGARNDARVQELVHGLEWKAREAEAKQLQASRQANPVLSGGMWDSATKDFAEKHGGRDKHGEVLVLPPHLPPPLPELPLMAAALPPAPPPLPPAPPLPPVPSTPPQVPPQVPQVPLTGEEMQAAYEKQQEMAKQQRDAEAAIFQRVQEQEHQRKQKLKQAVRERLQTEGFIFTPILKVRSAWAPPPTLDEAGADGRGSGAGGSGGDGDEKKVGVRLGGADEGQLVIEFQIAFGPGPLGITFRPSHTPAEKALAPACVLELPMLKGVSRRTNPSTGEVETKIKTKEGPASNAARSRAGYSSGRLQPGMLLVAVNGVSTFGRSFEATMEALIVVRQREKDRTLTLQFRDEALVQGLDTSLPPPPLPVRPEGRSGTSIGAGGGAGGGEGGEGEGGGGGHGDRERDSRASSSRAGTGGARRGRRV